jgi:hypothetical protein
MRNRPRVSLALALALGLVASLALASVVQAAPTTLTATLAGVTEGENPGDPDGSGTASVTLDPATGEACWELSATGIGAVMQSHIHVGGEGESGDVVVPLDTDGFDGTSEGCVMGQDAAALQAVIDDPAGHYVNLHTSEFPAGAIRGRSAEHRPGGTRADAPAGHPRRAAAGDGRRHRPACLAACGDARLAFSRPPGGRWRPRHRRRGRLCQSPTFPFLRGPALLSRPRR